MKKKSSLNRVLAFDFASWNFIVFLVLGFVLIVLVASVLKGPVEDLSAKAGFRCPTIRTLPRPESCQGGRWLYGRDRSGCASFECPPAVTPMPLPTLPGRSPYMPGGTR